MPRASYSVFREFLLELVTAWADWGADFTVDGTTKSDAETLLEQFDAKEHEINTKLSELATLRVERDAMAKRVETLGVRARLAVLSRFAPGSVQVELLPVFTRKHRGRSTKHANSIRQSAQLKRERIELAAREALKAELRAELEQEKARLD